MKTRSTSKSDPFLMLSSFDRRQTLQQDFDKEGKLSICKAKATDNVITQHLCGWACSCFLTRLNFLIAGILFLLIVYVLAETTYLFEGASEFLTGKPVEKATEEAKSVESFAEDNFGLLLMVGPVIGGLFGLAYYSKNCNRE